MNPYVAMFEKSKELQPEEDFMKLVSYHLQFGFVYSTPDFFVMGRPVNSEADEALIMNPLHLFPEAEWDCWYCHAMSGDMSKAWEILPFPLGYLAFHRVHAGVRELTIVDIEKLIRLTPRNLDEPKRYLVSQA